MLFYFWFIIAFTIPHSPSHIVWHVFSIRSCFHPWHNKNRHTFYVMLQQQINDEEISYRSLFILLWVFAFCCCFCCCYATSSPYYFAIINSQSLLLLRNRFPMNDIWFEMFREYLLFWIHVMFKTELSWFVHPVLWFEIIANICSYFEVCMNIELNPW